MIASLTPTTSQAIGTPYEQDFILTAYYSPLPDQCCYVKGSEVADKVLNGQGTNGADGTEVYPGMLAAPPTYAFGTRIDLPGLGIMTVHDRGGAIQELEKAHRLDVWAGHGEEGLARALEFGVKRIRGTVYPPGTAQPAERFALESLPAPMDKLKPYLVAEAGLIDMQPAFGERGLSVSLLQEHLRDLGYFSHAVTGMYGDVTKESLASFVRDMALQEPTDRLTETTAAYLVAALRLKDSASPLDFVGRESAKSDIQKAQRLLRYLGFYRGRTDGLYSDAFFHAVLSYQQSQQLVGDASSPGAGRIGPLTKGKLDQELSRRRVAAQADKLLVVKRVRELLVKQGKLLDRFLAEGDNGKAVIAVQTMLADAGFFPHDKINGNFGPLTAESVAKYQIARGLLKNESDTGAGNIGPVTMRMLRQEQVNATYRLVRARGWAAL